MVHLVQLQTTSTVVVRSYFAARNLPRKGLNLGNLRYGIVPCLPLSAEIDDEMLEFKEKGKALSVEEASYYKEGFVALKLPKELLSQAAEIGYFKTFGWSVQEAKMHMVPDYFSNSEWAIITEVLGPNPRHLFELYALKQSNYYQEIMAEKASTFEDIVDAYLAFLQITVVYPAMDRALTLVQKFAIDAQSGKISKDKLRFGAPWRHPPQTDDPDTCLEWAKLQLADFVQSYVNTEFGVNYLGDCSLEIFDDPSANAFLEVGLLYGQRYPSLIRPVSRGIQRCLVRWLVQEQMQMSPKNLLGFKWQLAFRGRSYRHLMLQLGYK
ncbi:hypothetical protein ACFE04_023426 [Oxalis oulophora]